MFLTPEPLFAEFGALGYYAHNALEGQGLIGNLYLSMTR